VFASYKGVTFAGEPLSPRARHLAESWGIELFGHGNVGDVTGCFECTEHDGMHFWEDTVFVEGADYDGDRCELVASTLFNRVAPLLKYRSDDIVRLATDPCACGRTHARMWPVGRKSDELIVDGQSVMPIDVWEAVETVEACALGLFQIIRAGPSADRLRLRVGYAAAWGSRLGGVDDEVRAAVLSATGIEPEVELVPNSALLRLGPPHKIPRVARR
jgi:phenylacetate-CoA ligase